MAVFWMTLVCVLSLQQLVLGKIENVAFEKPVKASSLYTHPLNNKKSSASHGVDGITYHGPGTALMHTADDDQPFAWWTVDLEKEVVDAEVKIYFRTNYKYRRNGLQLYTCQTPFSSYPGGQLCDNITGKANGTDIPDVYNVTCPGTWRHLMLYTVTDNNGQGPVLDFAEVKVLACADRSYGPSCNLQCGNCLTGEICDHVTGACADGCKEGWTGSQCNIDIDECTVGSDNFHADATCTNTVGSFTCACNVGYNGDGVTCTDIDECTVGSANCHADATCTNTVGSFTCSCNAGYIGDGVTCTDVDECTIGSDNCHADATCTNTVGSFTCACNAGYNGDGVTCTVCQCGTYGTGCTFNCGHCDGTCEVVNGTCENGCLGGYTGDKCSLKLSDGGGTKLDMDIIIAGFVGVAIALVSVACLILCLVMCGRLVWVGAIKDRKTSIEMTSTQMTSTQMTSTQMTSTEMTSCVRQAVDPQPSRRDTYKNLYDVMTPDTQPELYDNPQPSRRDTCKNLYDVMTPDTQPELYDNPQPSRRDTYKNLYDVMTPDTQPELYDNPQPSRRDTCKNLYDVMTPDTQPELYDNLQEDLYKNV